MLKPTKKYFHSYSARQSHHWFSMAIAFKSPTTSFFQLKKNNPETNSFLRFSSHRFVTPVRRFTPMAALSTVPTVGISETFTRLKKQGKVSNQARKQASFIMLSNPHISLSVLFIMFQFHSKKNIFLFMGFSLFNWVVGILFYFILFFWFCVLGALLWITGIFC